MSTNTNTNIPHCTPYDRRSYHTLSLALTTITIFGGICDHVASSHTLSHTRAYLPSCYFTWCHHLFRPIATCTMPIIMFCRSVAVSQLFFFFCDGCRSRPPYKNLICHITETPLMSDDHTAWLISMEGWCDASLCVMGCGICVIIRVMCGLVEQQCWLWRYMTAGIGGL